MFQRADDLQRNVHHFCKRQWTIAQGLLECVTVQQFHCKEGIGFVAANVIDRYYVGMIQASLGDRLLQNFVDIALVIARLSRVQELDSYVALQRGIESSIDRPHPASPQTFIQLEVVELVAYQQIFVQIEGGLFGAAVAIEVDADRG